MTVYFIKDETYYNKESMASTKFFETEEEAENYMDELKKQDKYKDRKLVIKGFDAFYKSGLHYDINGIDKETGELKLTLVGYNPNFDIKLLESLY